MKKIKLSKKDIFLDAAAVIIGSVCYAVSVDVFLQPKNITVGGATGVATVLNSLFGTPIGLMIIVINIPLVLLAWKMLGSAFIARSAIGLAAMSVAIDLLPKFEIATDDVLLRCFFGGAVMGFSLGVMFVRGYTTGGSDFVVWMLRKKFPHMSTGIIYLLVDAAVIVLAAVVSRDAQQMLYSVLTIYVSQKFIDLVMSLGENSEYIYIISDKYDEIAECITQSFGRGVTVLNGEGFYTKSSKKVLLCAMQKNQYYPIVSKAKAIDANVFVICSTANRVVGNGFKPFDS